MWISKKTGIHVRLTDVKFLRPTAGPVPLTRISEPRACVSIELWSDLSESFAVSPISTRTPLLGLSGTTLYMFYPNSIELRGQSL